MASESYTNADGYLCRDYVIKAYNEGTKYRIYYEGDFDDIVIGYDCEAVYAIKKELTTEDITEEATTEEEFSEPVDDDELKKENTFLQTRLQEVEKIVSYDMDNRIFAIIYSKYFDSMIG